MYAVDLNGSPGDLFHSREALVRKQGERVPAGSTFGLHGPCSRLLGRLSHRVGKTGATG